MMEEERTLEEEVSLFEERDDEKLMKGRLNHPRMIYENLDPVNIQTRKIKEKNLLTQNKIKQLRGSSLQPFNNHLKSGSGAESISYSAMITGCALPNNRSAASASTPSNKYNNGIFRGKDLLSGIN
jgi:hypothetical protein